MSQRTTEQEMVCPRCHGKGKIPAQCVCWDSGTWNVSPVPAVCDKYVPEDDDDPESACVRCDHDKACHEVRS